MPCCFVLKKKKREKKNTAREVKNFLFCNWIRGNYRIEKLQKKKERREISLRETKDEKRKKGKKVKKSVTFECLANGNRIFLARSLCHDIIVKIYFLILSWVLLAKDVKYLFIYIYIYIYERNEIIKKENWLPFNKIRPFFTRFTMPTLTDIIIIVRLSKEEQAFFCDFSILLQFQSMLNCNILFLF